jgi:hypothetical protein
VTTLSFALACVAALAGAGPAAAIVGGAPAPIAAFPYQVALVKSGSDVYDGQFCGGTIRDASHVITAAHCVFDNALTAPGQAIAPGMVDVVAGTDTLDAAAPGQRIPVDAAAVDPTYRSDNASNDAALLTLARPIALGPTAAALPILSTTEWSVTPPGTRAVVSGWGATTPPASPLLPGTDYPTQLQAADVPLVADATCAPAYSELGFDPASSTCAGEPQGGVDACHGDSGGPLAQTQGTTDSADDRLVGIVSYGGVSCGSPTVPGVYTDVTYDPINSFLLQPNPPPAPANTAAPVLSGVAAIGQVLTCSPGSWTEFPSFSYEFVRSQGSVDVSVAASGTSPVYTVTAQDAGMTLRCDVTATNPGGSGVAESAATGVIAGPPSTTPPTPQPPQTSLDLYAPVARITKVRCTATRCTLSVTVKDAGFSAGIKTVKATVRSTYRSTCKRHGRRVACTKHKSRTATVKALSATRFQVVASKLPVGKQLFTLVAVDKAGHRQALPTRKTVTTKRKKKRR